MEKKILDLLNHRLIVKQSKKSLKTAVFIMNRSKNINFSIKIVF